MSDMMNETLCAECNQPIDEKTPYFWGRHGGEWHPACKAAMEAKGGAVTGMWCGQKEPFKPPVEYILAKRGLCEGAGI